MLMSRKCQSIIEYVMLVAIVVAAFASIRVYVQRALSAHLKVIEDQVNNPEVVDEVRSILER